MNSPEHQKRSITEYVEIQAQGEKVVRAEKVASERHYDATHDVWDVQTEKDRYWVVTSPTNLYSHVDFPSMDYVLSFHIGLTSRMSARQHSDASEEDIWRTPNAWRQWERAHETLDDAKEPEDFQAIGVRCREVLITLTDELGTHEQTKKIHPDIKKSDVKMQLAAYYGILAPGSSMRKIRAHLITLAEGTWELVGWLTHYKNARREDAQYVMSATEQLMLNTLNIVVRNEKPIPERCPVCASYRMTRDFKEELTHSDKDPYIKLCEACGWEEPY